VLSQALAAAPSKFKLEFTVRNAEYLQPITEQLQKEDSKTTLAHSFNRSGLDLLFVSNLLVVSRSVACVWSGL